MGLRGPAKKPNALELAEGAPGHRALNDTAPQFAEGEPAMPASLSAEAKTIWRKTVPLLLNVPGLLSLVDSAVLADYCQVRADKSALERAIRSEQTQAVKREAARPLQTALALSGESVEPDQRRSAVQVRGEVYARSAGLLNSLRHQENVLRRELGLSPSSRSSLRIAGQGAAKGEAIDAALFSKPRLKAC